MSIFDKFKKKKEKPKKEKAQKKEKKPETSLKLKEISKPSGEKYKSLKPKVESLIPAERKEEGAKKAKSSETKEAYRILIKPLVTEKATNLVSQNKYSFVVNKKANKIEIAKAIKSLYGFEPQDINIINMGGKFVSYGRTSGKKKNWKKAIITLKPGNKIEIYEGV